MSPTPPSHANETSCLDPRLDATGQPAGLDCARFDAFFSSATAGMALFDTEFRYVRVNATLAAMNGVPIEDHVGRTVAEVVPWRATAVVPVLEQVRRSGKSAEHVPLVLQLSNGTNPRHQSGSFFPIFDAAGRMQYVGVVVVDVSDMKLAEQRCRETERRFQDIFQQIELIAVTLSPEGRVTFCNDHLLQLTGWARPEVLLSDWFSRFIPESCPLSRSAFTAHLAAGTLPRCYENPIKTRAGELRYIRWNNTVLRDDVGRITGTASIGEDVTERRRTEAALGESELRFRQLAESIHEVFWLTSPDKQTMLYVSPAYAAIWGRSCESLLAAPHSWLEAVHPDDREAVKRSLPAQHLGRWVQEYRIIQPDGQIRWIRDRGFPVRDPDGRVHRLAGVAEDITDWKAADQSRRSSDERVNAMFQSAPIAIGCATIAGTLMEANEQLAKLWGYSRAELLQRNVLELGVWENPAQRGALMQQLRREGAVLNVEAKFRRKDGEIRTTLFSAQQLQSSQQPLFIAMLVDITREKAIEAQLHQAVRMESIGLLAGGIAHDMNNILAPIMMAAPLLRADPEPELEANILERIETSAKRGADLVRQLLTLGREADAVRAPVNFSNLVQEVAKISRATFPRSISINVEAAADLWTLEASATQLHQVMLNLCVNARDAMPAGGRLLITAENVTCDESYAQMVKGLMPGHHVKLSVSDTGCGIPPEHISRIFEPFFTTKEPGKGTGIGLLTVANVVQAHRGVVTVRSTVGQGTTFDVWLPATPGLEAQTPAAVPPAQRGHGELVLVVDDEEAVRLVLSETLSRHGYRVATAMDGADALVEFTKARSETKVVITDLDMPMMDGTSLVRALRRECPELPIVLSTGIATAPAAQNRRREVDLLGISGVLTKPYRANDLLHMVKRAITSRAAAEAPVGA